MVELILLAAASSAEAVSEALIDDLGALSASVEDADAGTAAERALFGEPGAPASGAVWQRSLVRALFEAADDASRAATALLAQHGEALHLRSIDAVADEDWVRLTQSQFSSTEVAPGFWVVPTWREPPADAHRVIRLDPGMAFGTGTHPTTRLCLAWIARRAAARGGAWSRVLDYGCGSGILAIGAALHGAEEVDAVDIDPLAVQATPANAAANHVRIRTGLPDAAQGRYELVLANILATPLKLLAPLLCAHLDADADLVLAGILERQAGEIAEAYRPWISLAVESEEEGWILMSGRSSTARMA
jgi:ribosomal protein L11 methyltransferase